MSNKKDVQQGDDAIYIENVERDVNINYPQKNLPKELTAKLPKLRIDQTIGRTKDLQDLQQRLFEQKQVVLVNGMGGIGKTTLAQVYMNEYYDAYQHIAWIELDPDNNDVRSDLVNAKGLLSNLNIDTTGRTVDEIFVAIITTLKQIPKQPCLLVLDNADNTLSKIYNYLPTPPHWHVLATAREKITHFDIVELGFLSEEDAILLFKKHYTHSQLSNEDIKQFVNAIDLHTLTIEIMAKTAQRQRIEPQQLMQAIEQDLASNVQVRHSDDKIGKITTYLCSTFKVAQLNEAEQNLLLHFICLPLEMYSYELLEKIIGGDHLNYNLAETLIELYEKGWLLYNKENDSFKIHRIIIDVVKKTLELSEEKVETLIKRISDILHFDETKDNPVDKFVGIPFGKVLEAHFSDSTSTNLSKLQYNLATVLRNLGDYEGAKNLFEKAMRSAEQNFGESHPTTAESYSNLATVLQDLGDYKEAKNLLEKAKLSLEQNYGVDHAKTAVCYSNLASVLKALGDFEEAKKLFEKAMQNDEKNFGGDHPITAVRYSNLALLLQDLGDYKEAKNLLKKAIRSDKKYFDLNHPRFAQRYSNLAIVYINLGNYEKANKMLKKAKRNTEQNFGEVHPTTAVIYSNLASVLQYLEDFEEAKKLFEKAWKIMHKHLGEQHPKVKTIKGNLDYLVQLMNEKSS